MFLFARKWHKSFYSLQVYKNQHGKIITSNKSTAQNKSAHSFKSIVLIPTVYCGSPKKRDSSQISLFFCSSLICKIQSFSASILLSQQLNNRYKRKRAGVFHRSFRCNISFSSSIFVELYIYNFGSQRKLAKNETEQHILTNNIWQTIKFDCKTKKNNTKQGKTK